MVSDLDASDKLRERPACPPCERPNRKIQWHHGDGIFVPQRCGRSNSCPHCSWLAGRENVAVVYRDAQLSGEAGRPHHTLTLTTRHPNTTAAEWRVTYASLARKIRQEFPIEYLALIEHTKGDSPTSDGYRRLHAHTLLKGLPPGTDLRPLRQLVSRHMKRAIDAPVIDLAELRSVNGATAYMVGHHQKKAQAPPQNWSGKRIRSSRGYYTRPVAELREQVRRNQQYRTNVYKLSRALEDKGVDPDSLDQVLYEQLLTGRPKPQLVRVNAERDGQVTSYTPIV